MGHSLDALPLLDKVIELNPKLEQAWISRGEALYFLGRGDEALDAFKQAISLNPRAASAWAAFGALLASLERYEEALRSLDHALANDIVPKEPRTYKLKAEALQALGRTAEAEAAAAEAARLELVHAEALADDPGEQAKQDNNA